MTTKSQNPTMTDLDKVAKILAKYVSQTKNAGSKWNPKKEPNASEIAEIAKPNNILKNLIRQTSDINDINTQNQNLIAPFTFYVNAIQNYSLMPNVFNPHGRVKKNRL